MPKQRDSANTPSLSRSTNTTGRPAAAAAPVVPTVDTGLDMPLSSGVRTSPIAALYADWLDLSKEGQKTTSGAALDKVVARMTEVEEQIFARPSRCLEDLAVKVAISQTPSAWEEEQPLWQEIRQLLGGGMSMDDIQTATLTNQETPLVRKYLELREEAGAILAFKVGGFFEFWFEDAPIVAELCDIRLTRRGTIPMCGIPADARFTSGGADQVEFMGSSAPYFEAIVAAGHAVAIAVESGFVDGRMTRRIVARFEPTRSNRVQLHTI